MFAHRVRHAVCASSCLPILLAGCRHDASQPDWSTITGPVVSIILPATAEEQPTLHVKSSSADPGGIVFWISGATVIVRRVGTHEEAATVTDITLGQRVRVRASSMILESCPARSTAGRIELIP